MRQQWEDMTDGEFRGFMNSRVDELQDKMSTLSSKMDTANAKADEVLTLLKLGKVGAEVLRWCAGIGAAFATIWGAWHFAGPK